MRNLPLSEKLVLYFVLLGLIVIIAVAPFSYYIARKALLDRTFDQLTSVRVMKTDQLHRAFNDRLRDARRLINSQSIRELLQKQGYNELSTEDLRTIQFALEYEPLPSTEYVNNIIFFNTAKQSLRLDLVNDTLMICDTAYLPPIASQESNVFLSDYEDIPDVGLSILCYAMANHGSGLCMTIPTDKIDRIMLENDPLDGLGYSGESYLVGNDRLMRSSSRFREESILNINVNTISVSEAFNGNSGTEIISDYRGVDVLSSYSPAGIPGLDWVILAEIDLKETMAPIKGMRDSIIAISIIVSLVMFILAYFSARQLSRPLRRFGEAVKQVAQGKLDTKVEIRGSDEIAQLAESFNHMAGQLLENQEKLKKEQLRQYELTLNGQEKERQRLSRELHDGLGQYLIAIKLRLEQVTPENTCDAFKNVKEVRKSIDRTIDEIRNISNDLMPSSLGAFGLSNALRKLCQDVSQNSGLTIKTHLSKSGLKPGSKSSLYLYRIAQEALNNIVKHAQAKLVWVSLQEDKDHIQLEIRDNGRGIGNSVHKEKEGQGMTNIRERVKILNGKLEIQDHEDGGTLIRINIPHHEE